jgi:hypothetical protein
MLNIAEPVPPPESVPPIPRNRSSLYIRDLLGTDRVPPILGIPGIEFGRNYSEFRNQKKLSGILESDGIPDNSVSTQFPEFQKLLQLDQCRLGLNCTMMIEFPESDGFDSEGGTCSVMFNIAE